MRKHKSLSTAIPVRPEVQPWSRESFGDCRMTCDFLRAAKNGRLRTWVRQEKPRLQDADSSGMTNLSRCAPRRSRATSLVYVGSRAKSRIADDRSSSVYLPAAPEPLLNFYGPFHCPRVRVEDVLGHLENVFEGQKMLG